VSLQYLLTAERAVAVVAVEWWVMSITIKVLGQKIHQDSMRSTLKNLFCFAIFKGYLLSGCLPMNTANSRLD